MSRTYRLHLYATSGLNTSMPPPDSSPVPDPHAADPDEATEAATEAVDPKPVRTMRRARKLLSALTLLVVGGLIVGVITAALELADVQDVLLWLLPLTVAAIVLLALVALATRAMTAYFKGGVDPTWFASLREDATVYAMRGAGHEAAKARLVAAIPTVAQLIASAVSASKSLALAVALLGSGLALAQFTVSFLQIERLDEQNRLLSNQNRLIAADRSTAVLTAQLPGILAELDLLIDSMDVELPEAEGDEPGDQDPSLSDLDDLYGFMVPSSQLNLRSIAERISLLSSSIEPYQDQEWRGASFGPFSPERGFLLVSLVERVKAADGPFGAFERRLRDLFERQVFDMSESLLIGGSLDRTWLGEMQLDNSDLRGATFANANLAKASLRGALLPAATAFREGTLVAPFRSTRELLAAELRRPDDRCITDESEAVWDWAASLSPIRGSGWTGRTDAGDPLGLHADTGPGRTRYAPGAFGVALDSAITDSETWLSQVSRESGSGLNVGAWRVVPHETEGLYRIERDEATWRFLYAFQEVLAAWSDATAAAPVSGPSTRRTEFRAFLDRPEQRGPRAELVAAAGSLRRYAYRTYADVSIERGLLLVQLARAGAGADMVREIGGSLDGAYLGSAPLDDADLRGLDLGAAVLTCADVRQADLREAVLPSPERAVGIWWTGADLDGATVPSETWLQDLVAAEADVADFGAEGRPHAFEAERWQVRPRAGVGGAPPTYRLVRRR